MSHLTKCLILSGIFLIVRKKNITEMHFFLKHLQNIEVNKKIDKEEYEHIDNSKSFPKIVLLNAGSISSSALACLHHEGFMVDFQRIKYFATS